MQVNGQSLSVCWSFCTFATAIALMCRDIYMKRLKCIAPVDSISGMIGKRSDFISGAAFISNVRKTGGVASKGAAFMYFSVRMRDRSTPVSAAEIAHRTEFATIAKTLKTNLLDPTKLVTMQAYYAANKHLYYSFRQAAWAWTKDDLGL